MKIFNDLELTHAHLENAVSNDVLRPVMTGVYFDLINNCIVATDSHLLLVAPITIKFDESADESSRSELLKSNSKIVPIEFFDKRKYMGNHKHYSPQIFYSLADEKYAKVFCGKEEVFKCRYIEGNFPDYKAVMPNEFTAVDEIGLDIGFVQRLYKMNPFSNKGLRFKFTKANRAIRFESIVEPKFHGVIMPIVGC